MKDIDFEKIGKKLRETRISKGFTQEYIAEKADVNTSHISNIENNRVKISLQTLVNLKYCCCFVLFVVIVLMGIKVEPPVSNRLM